MNNEYFDADYDDEIEYDYEDNFTDKYHDDGPTFSDDTIVPAKPDDFYDYLLDAYFIIKRGDQSDIKKIQICEQFIEFLEAKREKYYPTISEYYTSQMQVDMCNRYIMKLRFAIGLLKSKRKTGIYDIYGMPMPRKSGPVSKFERWYDKVELLKYFKQQDNQFCTSLDRIVGNPDLQRYIVEYV
jgi:hypothetical protein